MKVGGVGDVSSEREADAGYPAHFEGEFGEEGGDGRVGVGWCVGGVEV